MLSFSNQITFLSLENVKIYVIVDLIVAPNNKITKMYNLHLPVMWDIQYETRFKTLV